MAITSQTWSMFTAVAVLTVQLCKGEKSCTIWSSAGPEVHRGSSFEVYCSFYCKCKGSMYSGHPPTPQSHKIFNSTTVYFSVPNITENRTYSCHCNGCSGQDPCGVDISVGYPPEQPKNISCIYKVQRNGSGVVFCSWNRGRDTYLWTSSVLCVRTVAGNHTVGPVAYNVSSKGSDSPSGSFNVSNTVHLISLWVQVQNPLGSEVSNTSNYTLRDIAMPSAPVLGHPKCSSQKCIFKVSQSVRTQHLEIQYRTEAQMWTSYPDSGVQMSSLQVQSITSLEPYSLYHFRARSKFSTGLWSPWSAHISGSTQEEAPAKELDVWYAEPASDFKFLRVYWKEANISIARGKIIQYRIRVYSQNSGFDFITNTSAEDRNYSVPFCANCEVTVWACNSKGLSPPARITTHHRTAMPPQDVQVSADKHGVTISWRKPETAPLAASSVVEWYPEGHKLEELRWLKLGGNDNHAVITGIKPFECYEGAVYVFYNESSVHSARFTGVATLESAPAAAPFVQEKVEGNKVKVTWTEIPRGQRGGCITKYTIYLENGSGHRQPYSVQASERVYIFNLSTEVYSLWMTASTAKGEGPAGQKVKFFIQHGVRSYAEETQLAIILVCAVFSPIALFLLCLCQSSAVKQRFWVFFQCLMLDVVPDPANSKWAKECIQEKGKMNLRLQLSNSNVTQEEEEPPLVDVEELPKQSSDTSVTSSHFTPQASRNPLTESVTLLYPLTTYIKSFSHDSDSSDHTQISLDTNMTVDYISSHGPGNTDMEDQEEEEEDEFAEMLGFFPSHNILIGPLEFTGKLTLDAVRIDCNDFSFFVEEENC